MKEAPDLLGRLVEEARQEVDRRRSQMPEAHLERIARAVPPARDFVAALRGPGLSVIAEMKFQTPSMGVLADSYAPGQLADLYQQGGAAALSVLCQETSFGGRPEHLAEARATTELPVLRKDFVVTDHQVLEARAYGADAVLLIVAALSPSQLGDLLGLIRRWKMEALIEVHDGAELAVALEAGAALVGVNHRDLDTFEVDLGLTELLRPQVPDDVVYVAESGIGTAQDAWRMHEAGADAILVGEALMRSHNPVAKIQELSVG
jgi:indole-3-glycerol phosphate synthase